MRYLSDFQDTQTSGIVKPFIETMKQRLNSPEATPREQALAKLFLARLLITNPETKKEILSMIPELETRDAQLWMKKQFIQLLPKAELHIHMDGSVIPETVIEEHKHQNIPMKYDEPEMIKNLSLQTETVDDWQKFTECFSIPISVMQTKESLTRIGFEVVEQAHKDGLIYIEPRFAPCVHQENGLTYDEILDSVIEGLNKGKEKYGIRVGLTAAIFRSPERDKAAGESPALETAKAVLRAAKRHPEIQLGLDIVGLELGYPADDPIYQEAFDYVLENRDKSSNGHVHTIAHAGEMDGTGHNVPYVIKNYKAERIGHGIHADFKNIPPKTKRNVIFEVCPSSNYQLSNSRSYDQHQLFQMLKNGIRVTINTDNRTVSKTTVTDELFKMVDRNKNLQLFRKGKISPEIRKILHNGIDGAYLSKKVKRKLHRKTNQDLAQLNQLAEATGLSKQSLYLSTKH